jgi:hypothetical protein
MGGGGGGSGGSVGGVATGNVLLLQSCATVGGSELCGGSVSANFQVDDGGYDAWHSCTRTQLGSCSVVDCLSDGGIPTLPPPLSAGKVSVAGTLVDGGITLDFLPYGYQTYPVSSRVWNPGDTLTVNAAGAAVAGFSGKSVVVPNEIVLTAPACSGDNCGTASRSAALNLMWTGGASSGLRVELLSAIPAGGGHSIVARCSFTSSPASIPLSVMASLGANTDGYASRLNVQPVNTTGFGDGAFQVTLTALGALTTGMLTVSN